MSRDYQLSGLALCNKAVDELQAAESAGVCAQAPGARMQGQMCGCRIHEQIRPYRKLGNR